ncbi:hypothetical protein [Arcobacter peruensis]|uniref:hypothetical protein n=1 Tax=Arcobacter peruensis TaxID=2320140 RepID=UPI0013DF392F|nr:hypothetical protein [Arcobacter peruensis]
MKSQFKSDTLYQDIILYEIFCIRKTDYLYKNKSIKLLHSLLKEITSYTSVKVLLELEVALLRDDMSEFNKVFNKNRNLVCC